MKRLLLLTTVLLLSINSWSAAQVWYENASNADGWYAFGTEKIEKYSAAVFIPQDLMGTENLKIGGVSINMGTPNFKNLKVWVSTSLPNVGMSGDVMTMNVSNSLITVDQYSNVSFGQFYDVPEGGVYVGYTFDVTSLSNYGNMPISYAMATQQREGSFFVNTTSMGEWLTDSEVKLMMNVLVECDAKDNSVKADDFGTAYTVLGTQGEVGVRLTNTGGNAVNSIAYTVTTEGKVSEERTASTYLPNMMSTSVCSLVFDADETTTPHAKTITITKVNGQLNNAAVPTADGTLITVTHKPTYRPVIEEFTGTWCGWCPYGIAGMKSAHKKYGDKVVLIAAHASDIMAIDDYSPILSLVSSYPSAFFNREVSFYPNSSNMSILIDQSLHRTTVADIDTKAYWDSEDQKGINLYTTTTFVYDSNEANYGIAYVLLANGLTGTTASWAQSNNLSGQSGSDTEMLEWYTSGSKVTGLKYDHVAIGACGIKEGLEESLAPQITAGKEQKFAYTLSIEGNSLVQDKSQLSVVTLLVDNTTGIIMNATQTKIEAPEANNINGITSSTNQTVKYYNLQGQEVGDDYRGIVVTKGRKMLRR
jgi:thiol-disulfide isomerase/thioredoxin